MKHPTMFKFVFDGLEEYYAPLRNKSFRELVILQAAKEGIKFEDTGNRQNDYELLRDKLEVVIEKAIEMCETRLDSVLESVVEKLRLRLEVAFIDR